MKLLLKNSIPILNVWIVYQFLFCLSVLGQSKYEILTTSDGLSQGMIFDILQDREGFIWIATKDGLNRYDGYEFKIFTNDPYNNQSLSNNTVVRLFEDSKSRIWACAENAGLNIYDKRKGAFYRIENSNMNPKSISGNNIIAIEELFDGRIIVANDVKGLDIIELPDNFLNSSESPIINKITLPENIQVYGIGKDKTNRIIVGGMDGSVYTFDEKQLAFTAIPNGKLYNNGYLNKDSSVVINKNLYLDDGNITPLFDTSQMPEGNIILRQNSALWDNYHRELYFYDISRWDKSKSLNWNKKLPINQSKRIMYPFIIDRSGILWNGTVGYGIRKSHTTESKFNTIAKGNSIRLIKPINDNEIIWVDYSYKWMMTNGDQKMEAAFSKIPFVTEIDNILISKTKDYYIKSDNKGYFKYNPTTNNLLPLPFIHPNHTFGKKQPFLEDSNGCIWFPGKDGSFVLLNNSTGKKDSFNINQNGSKLICTALYEDNNDIFWVGTEVGFAKVKIDRNKISNPDVTWFYNDPNNRNSLNYNFVTCFLNDPFSPNQYLWITTKGGGLNRFDKMKGDFFHITTKDGLLDNVVYGLLNDESRNIWGSTNKGIFCMTIDYDSPKFNFSFRNFTKKEGLQGDEFNTGAYAKFPNGNLAFGGTNGINVFNPKMVLKNGFEPNVFFTKILIANKPVIPNDKTGVLNETIETSKSITLNHLQDILTLEFSSLDFTNPAQNKYRYRLIGIDKEWIQSGVRHSATYLHLPDGKYLFKVQGSNSEGIWSEKMAKLQIIVLPPWWATWWAYLAYALMIGIVIKTYLQYRLNQTKIESQLILEQNEAKRIKELDTLKTKLYTNITHEFRTPLTVILGMVQQIKSGPDEHFTNGLDMIERNGKNLLNLVNEMLDLSKLEAGKMTLQLTQGDVIQFLRYIVESFHSMAESQDIQMHYLASLEYMIAKYDAEKLRQVVSNLLSNALKFTDLKGNIYISISSSKSESEFDNKIKSLIIKIKDTGRGIPDDQILHIFDRFYQADNSHTRNAEGTGIGLALTKELVQLMNGTIEVKSPPIGARKGTEFTVSLPLECFEGSDEYLIIQPSNDFVASSSFQNSKPANPKEFDKPTNNYNELILLVEDNTDVVAYTASCLPEYRLVVGKDGQEGFDIACQIIPDLIISDVMMPFVDGFEMCKRLRQDERTSHIPIIMLTAKADMKSKLEGIEYGADAYLEKPFYKDELRLRIKKLLEQRKLLQKVYSKLAGLQYVYDNIALENDTKVEISIPKEIPKLEDAFVKKVRMEIELHISDENYSVERLSKNIYMSHSQVHRKLNALTGFSPNQFIRIIRMQKACILLKTTNDSISNISEVCGFSDPSYFGKVFRQENNMTPQEYRNSIN